MGFFSDFFDPGRADRKRAGELANSALLQGGSFGGPGGISAGFRVGADGIIGGTLGLGQFNPLLMQLLGITGDALAGKGAGIPDKLRESGAAAQSQLAPELQGELGNLQSLFQSALPTAMADPFALGASVTDQLRPGLERAQGTLRNTTFDKLFATGRQAVSSAASPILEGLQRTFGEQNAALDVQGLNIGRGLQQDALSRLFSSLSGAGDILGMNAGRAMQSFGIDRDLFGLERGSTIEDREFGLRSLQSATGVSQLPLAFQSALASLQGMRSNAALGAAGVHAGNAANARSPFLEALEAAGGFASSVGLGFGG